MKDCLRIFVFGCMALALCGCSILANLPLIGSVPERMEDPEDYLDPEQTPDLYIPSDMPHREIEDNWVIPPITDQPRPRLFPRTAPRPESIVGEADPDLVRIQTLGPNRSWMVVQRPPETVWPVIKQWIHDNEIGIEHEDPASGLIFCEQLNLKGADPLELRAQVSARKQDAQLTGDMDWIAIRLETSMRHGSSEVHIRYLNDLEAPDLHSWPEASSNYGIERAILEVLANYDAAGYVAPTVSSIAQNIALRFKVEQLNDERGFPLLRLNVDYARAWATLQKAIENSELNIIGGGPEDGYFEIEMSRNMRKGRRQGLLAEFVRRNSNTIADLSSIRVHLKESVDSFDVFVDRATSAAISAEFAQDFLSVLRENVI
ncbi:MAG: outer membrane protein assembly factor BamC [Gammaproteobacteria bacterium]|nr:outer membrane protein assembly factor BamC [Gammaproteobacteria bacterium]